MQFGYEFMVYTLSDLMKLEGILAVSVKKLYGMYL